MRTVLRVLRKHGCVLYWAVANLITLYSSWVARTLLEPRTHLPMPNAPGNSGIGSHSSVFVLFAMTVIALFLYGLSVFRPGLWSDEIFSIAIASGHSLDQPVALQRGDLGDFVYDLEPRPASHWRAYLAPTLNLGGVWRAVFLSDLNPPLYYLTLNVWMTIFSNTDISLRLFSVMWALLSMPIFWNLGKILAGRDGAVTVLAVFVLSPFVLYYSVEVRMYSMLIFFSSSLLYATAQYIRFNKARWICTWSAAAVFGMWTHLFFVFVLITCLIWLSLSTAKKDYWKLASAVGFTVCLLLPWYVHVPTIQGEWRVGTSWQYIRLPPGEELDLALRHLAGLFAGVGFRQGWGPIAPYIDYVLQFIVAVAFAISASRILRDRILMLLCTIPVATVAMLFAADLTRGMSLLKTERYVIAALPAALAALACAVLHLRQTVRYAVLLLVILVWSSKIAPMATGQVRPNEPYNDLAAAIDRLTPDLVILNSIPSGVLGLARYLRSDLEIAPILPMLRNVTSDHVDRWIISKCRVAFIDAHQQSSASELEFAVRRVSNLEETLRFSGFSMRLYKLAKEHAGCRPAERAQEDVIRAALGRS